jgi:hypothetical protein
MKHLLPEKETDFSSIRTSTPELGKLFRGRCYGAYQLKNVRQLIKRKAAKQEQLEFMQEHPIIRSMDVYGDLVRNSLRKPPPSWQADNSSKRPSGSD